MRILLVGGLSCALLALACSSDGDDLECGAGTTERDGVCEAEGEGAGGPVCGDGTREDDGQCVPDGPQPQYELRASVAEVGADGRSLIPILAIGMNADGTPATDPVVLSVDRTEAGELFESEVTLAANGTLTYFRPCDAAAGPDCAGPSEIRMALADDPERTVATLALELVEQTGVYTAAPCLAGGNTLFFDGDGFIRTGLLTVTRGIWSGNAPEERLNVEVSPAGQLNGDHWRLSFSSTLLDGPLTTGVYQMAQRVFSESPGHPGMDIGGDGRGCNTIGGGFQVHELEKADSTLLRVTISFEQHCEPDTDDPQGVLYGCVHYEE